MKCGYWTDDAGNRRWNHLYVSDKPPRLGLWDPEMEPKTDIDGRDVGKHPLITEPKAKGYRRQVIPEDKKTTMLTFDVEKCMPRVGGIFIVDSGVVVYSEEWSTEEYRLDRMTELNLPIDSEYLRDEIAISPYG